MTRFFVRLLNGTLLFAFCAFIWGGLYLSERGFGQKWRKKLAEEFAEKGVQISVRRLTLDPLRGLVARDVRVYSDAGQEQVIAKINELRLDIDYTRMLRNEPFLDALSLSEAQVNLDLDPRHKNSGELTLKHLEARFSFAADHLEIRRFQGRGMGLWFSISGTINHGGNWQISADPAELWKQLTSLPENWQERLREMKFAKRLGHLDLRFHGDLRQTNWLQTANLRMQYPRLRWKEAVFEDLKMEADFSHGTLSLQQLTWKDDRGPASLTGSWKPGKQGNFHLQCGLDLTPFLQEVTTFSNLAIDGSMRYTADLSWREDPEFQWQIIGDVDFSDVLFRGVRWNRLQSRFSFSKDRWLLQDFQLDQKAGTLFGQMMRDGSQIQMDLRSTVDPQSVWQSLAIHVPPILAEAEFPVSPLVKMKVSGPAEDFSKWQIDGSIILGRTHFRGVALTSAQASFHALGPSLFLEDLQITRPEGGFSGDVVWNSATGDLLFWNAASSIDFAALSLWMDTSWSEAINSMRPGKGIWLEGDGRVSWKDEAFSTAEMHLKSRLFGPFAPPMLENLLEQAKSADGPETLAATVLAGSNLLEINPLVITGKGWSLTGKARWTLPERAFTGQMNWLRINEPAKNWRADGGWNAPVWKTQ